MSKNFEERHFLINHVGANIIAENITFEDEGYIPEIICAIAPCRTGTTAQLKVFAGANIDSYYQPLKSIYRRIAFNKDYEKFLIPKKNTIFIKETIGPYSLGESEFNPLKILEEFKYPKSKLKIIFEVRDPIDTYLSWINQFLSHKKYRKQMLNIFIKSYKTIDILRNYANNQKLFNISYTYESIRDNSPELIVKSLFRKLDIEFMKSSITGWENKKIDSKIHFSHEPSVYEPENLHDEVKKSKGLKYNTNSIDYIKSILKQNEIEKIRKSNIYQIYENILNDQEKTFNIEIKKDYKIKYLP